jgi:Domain of unknown function (DUF4062)
MGEPQEPGAAASPREEPAAGRAGVILTPDQRVRVFISSTLEELAEERAAARRAITRLHLVPVWYESSARALVDGQSFPCCVEGLECFAGVS